MQALEEGATTRTRCKALDLSTPWRGDCLSHAVNGAMNRACTSLIVEKKKKSTTRAPEAGEGECDDMNIDDAAGEEGSPGSGAMTVKSDVFAPVTVKAVIGKMQSCITWTKKSSVGWRAMKQAAQVCLM